MHKNKMTLFAVILFGFTTAFSMKNVGASNEDAKKCVEDFEKFAEQIIFLIPENSPYKRVAINALNELRKGVAIRGPNNPEVLIGMLKTRRVLVDAWSAENPANVYRYKNNLVDNPALAQSLRMLGDKQHISLGVMNTALAILGGGIATESEGQCSTDNQPKRKTSDKVSFLGLKKGFLLDNQNKK